MILVLKLQKRSGKAQQACGLEEELHHGLGFVSHSWRYLEQPFVKLNSHKAQLGHFFLPVRL